MNAMGQGGWEDESDSGSENDWWNQPSEYLGSNGGMSTTGGMPGSYNSGAQMQGYGAPGSYGGVDGGGMQQYSSNPPYADSGGFGPHGQPMVQQMTGCGGGGGGCQPPPESWNQGWG